VAVATGPAAVVADAPRTAGKETHLARWRLRSTSNLIEAAARQDSIETPFSTPLPQFLKL
jgi:hypothetical protein